MERKLYIDIARGIVITGMVIGHIISWLPVSGIYYDYIKFIYIYQMPFFFIISGFHLKLEGEKPLHNYLNKRIGGIMIPFLVWCLVTSVFKTALSPQELTPVEILKMFIVPPFIHGNFTGSWFLPCFFWAQLTVVLCSLLFKTKKLFAFAVFTIGFFGMALPLILSPSLYNIAHKYHGFDVALAASGLVGLGVLIKDKINYENNLYALISAVLLFISYRFNKLPDMFYSRYNYIPLFLSGAAGGSYLVLYISKRIESHFHIVTAALSYAGKNSLWILILHGSFGFTLNYILGQSPDTPAGVPYYVLYILVLTGGPLLTVYLFTLIKDFVKNARLHPNAGI